MLSQKLLEEILRLDNLVEQNIYEDKAEKYDYDVKKGFHDYIKETVSNNLGKNAVDLVL